MALAGHAAKHRAALRDLGQGEAEQRGDRRRRIFPVDDALQKLEPGIFRHILVRNRAKAESAKHGREKLDFAHAALLSVDCRCPAHALLAQRAEEAGARVRRAKPRGS